MGSRDCDCDEEAFLFISASFGEDRAADSFGSDRGASDTSGHVAGTAAAGSGGVRDVPGRTPSENLTCFDSNVRVDPD